MSVSPGWYDDPQRPGVERFHDGRAWTAHVRNDLPDIPLAPWVDSRTVVRPVDARPPRSTRAAASAVGLGLLGIVLVTWAGASTTVAALGNGAVEPVVAPTEGGDPVLPLHDCDDVATATASLAREYGDLPLAGWAGAPVTVADHQPVTALPRRASSTSYSSAPRPPSSPTGAWARSSCPSASTPMPRSGSTTPSSDATLWTEEDQ